MDNERKQEIKEEVRTVIFRQTITKYRILSVKAKISYHAFVKRQTIAELIFRQILNTYYHAYEHNIEYPEDLVNKFAILVCGDLNRVFRKLIEFELELKKFKHRTKGLSSVEYQNYCKTKRALIDI